MFFLGDQPNRRDDDRFNHLERDGPRIEEFLNDLVHDQIVLVVVLDVIFLIVFTRNFVTEGDRKSVLDPREDSSRGSDHLPRCEVQCETTGYLANKVGLAI